MGKYKAQMIQPLSFARTFEVEIQSLPINFYDSFEFTKRRNNLTHPITIGLITKVLINLASANIIGHDIRFNEASRKFQPDIVILNPDLEPLLYIDYESPNSSDARVPIKDVRAYTQWVEDYHDALPYFIITTLPNKPAPEWQLRHTGKEPIQFRVRRIYPARNSKSDQE